MKNPSTLAAKIWDMAVVTAGVAVVSAAVFFFLIPSSASVSSVTGLAIVLVNFVPLSIPVITFIINAGLLVLGFLLCGRGFGAKTVYCALLFPVFLGVLEALLPDFASLTGSAELDVLCYVLAVSIGQCILFNRNASSGGLDIVAKILNKYFRMELGTALSAAGMCIALSSALVYDAKTVVLSVLGTWFNGIVLDKFIFGQNIKRRVCIITKEEKKLTDFILHELHSGATVYEAHGAYTGQVQRELITIVDRSEYQRLMGFINALDPEAFIAVYTVSDMRYRPKR